MLYRAVVVVLISVMLASCRASASPLAPPATVSTPTPVVMAPAATAYLEEALNIMQEHSIKRDTVDWPTLRRVAQELAAGAQTPAQTYYAIGFALRLLGDQHSSFLPPDEVTALESGAKDRLNQPPAGDILAKQIGYVRLPAFLGSEQAAASYATTVQTRIRELDSANPCGWIVDLWDNRGGNMWPMLAGIGPLLGDESVGAYIDPNGQTSTWFYRDGQAGYDDAVLSEVPAPVYRLKRSLPPVAVLTSHTTGSSGEGIAVAFRGRPQTRSFGQPTAGLSTANAGFPLSDGALLNLTVETFADRTGQIYGQELVPDEQMLDYEQARQAALDWLLAQPACTEMTRSGSGSPNSILITQDPRGISTRRSSALFTAKGFAKPKEPAE